MFSSTKSESGIGTAVAQARSISTRILVLRRHQNETLKRRTFTFLPLGISAMMVFLASSVILNTSDQDENISVVFAITK